VLKLLVLGLSIWLLYDELYVNRKFVELIDFLRGEKQINYGLFAFATVLNVVNWSGEALKWRLLVRPYEAHSFFLAFKSVLSGLFVGFFTPNRVGEFAGRIIYVKSNRKIEAALLNSAGGLAQNLCTFIFGFAALISLEVDSRFTIIFWVFLFSAGLSFIFLFFNLDRVARIAHWLKLPKKILKYLLAFRKLKLNTLLFVLLISACRYLVFSFQYYLVFQAFGADIGIIHTFLGVSGLFVLQGLLPTIALSELTVRGPLAQLMFSDWVESTAIIYMVTYSIWLINIFLPAIFGGILFLTNRRSDVGI